MADAFWRMADGSAIGRRGDFTLRFKELSHIGTVWLTHLTHFSHDRARAPAVITGCVLPQPSARRAWAEATGELRRRRGQPRRHRRGGGVGRGAGGDPGPLLFIPPPP